jgi:hypothetical protein
MIEKYVLLLMLPMLPVTIGLMFFYLVMWLGALRAVVIAVTAVTPETTGLNNCSRTILHGVSQ